MKLKINNIEGSGGRTTTRHVLTTTDILLNYYLNFMFIIEMVINSFSSIINSKEFSSENNSINYVFLKFV